MKSKIRFTLIYILIAYNINASNIKGIVIDNQNKKALQFCTIQLLKLNNKDSTFITGTITDEKGKFVFKNIKVGNYLIKISFVSFQDTIIPILVKEDATYNIGAITLKNNMIELKTVTIKPEENYYKQTINKIIAIPGKQIIKNSFDGTDVLKSINGLNINEISKNIGIVGKKNIVILVNGIEKNDQAYDYLKSLNPEQIKRIEITRNPSVKYDTEVSAVVNIIVDIKNQNNCQIKPDVILGNPKSDSYLLGTAVQFNYSKKSFNFFAKPKISYDNIHILSYSARTLDNNQIILNPLSSTDKSTREGLDFGFDYFINENNTLNYTESHSSYIYKQNSINIQKIIKNDTINTHNKIFNKKTRKRIPSTYSLYYKHNFKNPDKILSGESYLYTYKENIENNLSLFFYNYPDTINLIYTTNTNQTINTNKYVMRFKIDYEQNIFDSIHLQTGYHSYIQNINNSYHGFEDYTYKEYRNAFYCNFIKKFKSFSIQTGLRLENSSININNQNNNTVYTKILPKISIFKELNSKNSVKFYYSKNFNRPSITQINPYKIYIDNNTYEQGNIYLKPEIEDNFKLSYNLKANHNISLSPTVYFSNTNKVISQIFIPDTNKLCLTFDNIASNKKYGSELQIKLKFSFLVLQPYINIFYEQYKYDKNKTSNISYNASINSYIILPKNYFIYSQVKYYGWKLIPQGKEKYVPLIIFAISKNIKSKNLSLMLFAINPKFIFDYVYETKINVDNYMINQKIYNNQSFIGFEIKYNFIRGKIKKLNRKIDKEKEAKTNNLFF